MQLKESLNSDDQTIPPMLMGKCFRCLWILFNHL